MRLLRLTCVSTAAAAIGGACLGQTTLYVLKSENLSTLVKSESSPGIRFDDNTLWAGHSLAAVAYGGGRLFVGGQLGPGLLPLDGADADSDGDRTEASPFNVSIIKIDDILTFRIFRTVPESRVSVPDITLGYTGMDYAPNQGAGGSIIRGLAATYDTGGGGANLIARYNVDLAGSAVRVAPMPFLLSGFRIGSCGPSWDFGPTGNGVDYLPSGSPNGTPDGPVVSVLEFDAYGPYGTDPATLNAGLGSTLYELGLNNGPRLAPDLEPLLHWCDLDIDPRNGALAARADNTVLFATRNANGTATRIDLAPTDAANERLNTAAAADLPGQKIAILHGYADAAAGDLLVWNNRATTAAGQPFASVIKFNKTNRTPATDSGAPVTPTFLTAAGAPTSLPTGNGQYDFAWDQATQVLFILDAANNTVHLLTPEPPRSCCLTNGACFVLNTSACAPEVAGAPGAAGSSCNPTPCTQISVACCFDGGACQILGAAACMNFPGGGGVPQSLGSTCSPNLCPAATGACCTGSSCTLTTGPTCAGSFSGLGTACDFPGNPVTCCRANFNQAGGVTVQDIFDFLVAYFAGEPSADFNGIGGVSVQDIFDYLTAYFAGCA